MSEAAPAVFVPVEDRCSAGVIWARVEVDLDLAAVPAGRRELTALCAGRVCWLLVEIAPDRFVDLRGVRLLLDAARPLRARGGDLLLVSGSPQLRRVWQLLDLDGDLPLLGSAREAQEEVDRCHGRAGPGP